MTISKAMYQSVYNDQRKELDAFLGVVFKQLDVQKFHTLFEDILKTAKDGNDVYSDLLRRCGEAKGGPFSRLQAGLTALKEEKRTLADNVAKVMDPNRSMDGYVEIGFPGRMIRTLTPIMGLKGQATVVNTAEALADYIQSGFPRPYDTFVTLDCSPLPLAVGSQDVVSSFIGLHHCPEDKLDQFARSIHDTLRPGGIFLLRDHDAGSKKMQELAAVVHGIFNAATGVSLEEEIAEVRNFQGVDYWTRLLEKQGFCRVSEPFVREGDSTQNALVKFVKAEGDAGMRSVTKEKFISYQRANQRSYVRPLEQTHLTFTEWFNVESAQNLGNSSSFWDYSYFKDVARLWKGFATSWREARNVQSFSKVLFSDYTLMNSFITVMMSIEYIAKGILCTPLWLGAKLERFLPTKKEDGEWEKPALVYGTWLKEYGNKLETTTFYAQRYLPGIERYWNQFASSWQAAKKERTIAHLLFDRQTVKNVVTGIAMTLDLLFRAAVSTPVNWFFGGEALADARDIGLIVKAKHKIAGNGVQVVVDDPNNPYKGIIVPRYKQLEAILKEFAAKGIEVVEIAGQEKIMIDLVVNKDSTNSIEGVQHTRDYLPDNTKKLVAVLVDVKELHHFLVEHEKSVHRVYDY